MAEKKTCKTKALIVEGGAMRGIFSTGVLDGFIDRDFQPFDFCMGVSAGSTNLAAWICGQRGRNYKVIADYSCRPQFISFPRFLRGGHIMDLDWLWDITIKEIRLDLEKFSSRKIPFYIVTTNIGTGKAEYIQANAENMEELLKASCALPVLYKDYPLIENTPMADGGIADPIPAIKAYEMGARDITVILSRTMGYRKQKSRFPYINKAFLKDRKQLLESLEKRWEVYNNSLDFILSPPGDCTVKIIAPPEEFEVGRLTKERSKLDAGYVMGLKAAELYCED